MSEAPKKIWMAADDAFQEYYHQFDGDIPYICADIVDELVEALKNCLEFNDAYWKLINFSPSNTGTIKELIDKARTALSKLEENHD